MNKVLKYNDSFWKSFFAIIFLSASFWVSGQDKKDTDKYIKRESKNIQSTEKFQAGLKKFKAKDYVGAADKFLDAEFLSRSISMKAAAAKEVNRSR